MTGVLHKDDARLRDLIDDWKVLFPTVLNMTATRTESQKGSRSRKSDARGANK